MRMQISSSLSLCAMGVGMAVTAANSSSVVLQQASQLAACIRALDASCVIRLSDADAYRKVNAPDYDFEATQTRFFAGLKKQGAGYTRFDIGVPMASSTQGGIEYQIVPFTLGLRGLDVPRKVVRGYFVAISRDAGRTWRFVDATGLDLKQLRTVMPTYSSASLPLFGMPNAGT